MAKKNEYEVDVKVNLEDSASTLEQRITAIDAELADINLKLQKRMANISKEYDALLNRNKQIKLTDTERAEGRFKYIEKKMQSPYDRKTYGPLQRKKGKLEGERYNLISKMQINSVPKPSEKKAITEKQEATVKTQPKPQKVLTMAEKELEANKAQKVDEYYSKITKKASKAGWSEKKLSEMKERILSDLICQVENEFKAGKKYLSGGKKGREVYGYKSGGSFDKSGGALSSKYFGSFIDEKTGEYVSGVDAMGGARSTVIVNDPRLANPNNIGKVGDLRNSSITRLEIAYDNLMQFAEKLKTQGASKDKITKVTDFANSIPKIIREAYENTVDEGIKDMLKKSLTGVKELSNDEMIGSNFSVEEYRNSVLAQKTREVMGWQNGAKTSFRRSELGWSDGEPTPSKQDSRNPEGERKEQLKNALLLSEEKSQFAKNWAELSQESRAVIKEFLASLNPEDIQEAVTYLAEHILNISGVNIDQKISMNEVEARRSLNQQAFSDGDSELGDFVSRGVETQYATDTSPSKYLDDMSPEMQRLQRAVADNQTGGADGSNVEIVRERLNWLAKIVEETGNPEIAQNLIKVSQGANMWSQMDPETVANSIAKIVSYPDTLMTSLDKNLSALNTERQEQGLETISKEEFEADFFNSNPDIKKRYDESLAAKQRFDAGGSEGGITSSIQEFFKVEGQVEDGVNKFISNLAKAYEKLDMQVTKIKTEKDGTSSQVSKSAQEWINEIVQYRTDKSGIVINPLKGVNNRYYEQTGIVGEKMDWENSELQKTPALTTSLEYKAGLTGSIYGGNTPKENIEKAQQILAQKESELAQASEEEAKAIQAEINLHKKNIEILTNAQKSKTFGPQKNKIKPVVSGSDIKGTQEPPKRTQDELKELQKQIKVGANFDASSLKRGAYSGTVTGVTGEGANQIVEALLSSGETARFTGKSFLNQLTSFTGVSELVGADVGQSLQQEEKVISDVNEELTEHVEKVEQATEAEQQKIIISRNLTQQLGKESEAFEQTPEEKSLEQEYVDKLIEDDKKRTNDFWESVKVEEISDQTSRKLVEPRRLSDVMREENRSGGLTTSEIFGQDENSNKENSIINNFIKKQEKLLAVEQTLFALERERERLIASNASSSDITSVNNETKAWEAYYEAIEETIEQLEQVEEISSDGTVHKKAKIGNTLLSEEGSKKLNDEMNVLSAEQVARGSSDARKDRKEAAEASESALKYSISLYEDQTKKLLEISKMEKEIVGLSGTKRIEAEKHLDNLNSQLDATGDLISQEEISQNISEANLLTEQQRLILQDKLTKAVNDRTNGQSELNIKYANSAGNNTAEVKGLTSRYLENIKKQGQIDREIRRAELNGQGLSGTKATENIAFINTLRRQKSQLENDLPNYDSQKRTLNGIELTEEEINRLERERTNILQDNDIQMNKINSSVGETKGLFERMGENFKESFNQIGNALLAFVSFDTIKRGFDEFIRSTEELDRCMVDLQIASGYTRKEINEMMLDFNSLAKSVGKTTQEVAVAANDWLRAGYAGQEVTQLTEASMQLSTLGMIESSEATSYLISVLKGWKLEAGEVAAVVDKLTAVDMSAAISAGDLAEAMSRANNSAQLAGSTMDKYIGYITTVSDVTQKSASSVGESFKTLYSRYQNVAAGKFVAAQEDIESENYNEDEWSNLNDVEKSLGALGINIRSSVDSFRSFDDVLSEIASKWDTFTDVQQSGIATSMAGTRQRENFVTLMENWGAVEKYEEIAANSYGTAVEKMAAYTDSVDAAKERMTAAVEEWVLKLNQSDTIKWFYNSIAEVVNNLNLLIPALGAFLIVINKGSVFNTLQSGVGKLLGAFANVSSYIDRQRITGGGYASGVWANAKENINAHFQMAQQKNYATALSNQIQSLNSLTDIQKQIQTQGYTVLQNSILGLNKQNQAQIASLMLNNQLSDEAALAQAKEIMQSTNNVLKDSLLGTVTDELREERIKSIMKTAQCSREDAELAYATELLAEQRKKEAGIFVGKNVDQSSKTNSKVAIAKGAGTIFGGLLGTLGGGSFGSLIGSSIGGEQGASTGKMLGSMAGGALGSWALGKIGAGIAGITQGVSVSLGSMVGPIGAVVGLVAGAVIGLVKKHKEKTIQEAKEDFKELQEEYSNLLTKSTQVSRYDELVKGVDALGNNVSLTEQEYQEFISTSNALAETFPSLIAKTDAAGNSFLGMGGKVGAVSKEVENLINTMQKEVDMNLLSDDVFGNDFKDYKDEWKGATKDWKDAIDTQNSETTTTYTQEELDSYLQSQAESQVSQNREILGNIGENFGDVLVNSATAQHLLGGPDLTTAFQNYIDGTATAQQKELMDAVLNQVSTKMYQPQTDIYGNFYSSEQQLKDELASAIDQYNKGDSSGIDQFFDLMSVIEENEYAGTEYLGALYNQLFNYGSSADEFQKLYNDFMAGTLDASKEELFFELLEEYNNNVSRENRVDVESVKGSVDALLNDAEWVSAQEESYKNNNNNELISLRSKIESGEATLEEQERWAELIKQEADAEKKKTQILSKLNDYAWAQIRQSEAQDAINDLTSDQQGVTNTFINQRLSGVNLSDFANADEYLQYVTEMATETAQIVAENPVILEAQLQVDEATTQEEVVKAREDLLSALINAFSADGTEISEDELKVLIGLGFEYTGNSVAGRTDTSNWVDSQDIYSSIQGVVGNDIALGVSKEEFNVLGQKDAQQVFEWYKEGWLTSNSDMDTIQAMIDSNSSSDNLLNRTINFSNNINKFNSGEIDLDNRIKEFLEAGDFSKETIAKSFSDLPETVWKSIENTGKALADGEIVLEDGAKNIVASYENALMQEGADIAGLMASEMFPDIDAEGMLDSWNELKDAFASIKQSYEDINAAMKEQNATGRLSIQTILDLLSTNKDYIYALEVENGQIKLKSDAEQIMNQIRLQTIQANIRATIAQNEAEIEQLKTRKAEIELTGTYQTAVAAEIEAQNQEGQSITNLTNAWLKYLSVRRGVTDLSGVAQLDYTAVEGTTVVVDDVTAELIALDDKIATLEGANEVLKNLDGNITTILENGSTAKAFGSIYDAYESGTSQNYENVLNALGALIDKEWEAMKAFKRNDYTEYFVLMRQHLNEKLEYYNKQLKDSSLTDAEILDIKQKIIDTQKALNNLDDEEVEDQKSLLELKGASLESMIDIQKQLLETSDTEEERVQRQKELNELIREELELRQDVNKWQRSLTDRQLDRLSGDAYGSAAYDMAIGEKLNSIQDDIAIQNQLIKDDYEAALEYYMNEEGKSLTEAQQAAYNGSADASKKLREDITNLYELEDEYVETKLDAIEAKANDLQRQIDLIEKSRPKEWFNIEDIDNSFGSQITLLQQQISHYERALLDTSGMTDEQVQGLIDSLNEAKIALHEAQIEQLEAKEEVYNRQYDAVVTQIEMYKEEIQRAMEEIEETYDDELNKLQEQNEERERAIQLEDLLAAKRRANQEKERVYREGKIKTCALYKDSYIG